MLIRGFRKESNNYFLTFRFVKIPFVQIIPISSVPVFVIIDDLTFTNLDYHFINKSGVIVSVDHEVKLEIIP